MSEIQPGWVAPGGKYQLAAPPELGWVAVTGLVAPDIELPLPVANPPRIDWSFIRGLTSIPGNEYEEAA